MKLQKVNILLFYFAYFLEPFIEIQQKNSFFGTIMTIEFFLKH